MDNSNGSRGGGIGFAGALTILFIALKLCNVISWSWVWVLSPIWITIGLVLVLFIIIVIAKLITD